ncbi:MAG: hypothetical protein FWH32_06810 [Clostridiales bacterium]|nr:hypothetical protein [Clostridiales bacterium]
MPAIIEEKLPLVLIRNKAAMDFNQAAFCVGKEGESGGAKGRNEYENGGTKEEKRWKQ